MKAIVECLKGTKEKYELAQDGSSFVLDRMLKRKWIANYGFIPYTLQADGDGLDCYIIGKVRQAEVVDGLPICLIRCIDNMQVDNKLVCIAPTARGDIKWTVKKIFKFIRKYKKNCFPVCITWKDSNIRYEIAKCKAYYKIFRGGNSKCLY